jgi:hypothetical protein
MHSHARLRWGEHKPVRSTTGSRHGVKNWTTRSHANQWDLNRTFLTNLSIQNRATTLATVTFWR